MLSSYDCLNCKYIFQISSMGPKRKLGPKSRRRRKEETPSSSEDETETADTNRILLAEKLDPDYEKEEEVRSNYLISHLKK